MIFISKFFHFMSKPNPLTNNTNGFPQDVWTTPKPVPTTLFRMFHTNAPQIFTTPSTTTTTTLKTTANRFWEAVTTTIASTTTASTTTSTTSAPMRNFMDFRTFNNFAANDVAAGMTTNLTNSMIF